MRKNKLNKFKTSVFTLFFVLVVSSLNAATYTTLSNGDWNDMSNVWSLDGVTSCGCEPGATTNGNTIVMRHELIMTTNVFVDNGSQFTVESTGSLTGTYNMSVNGADANIYGSVTLAKFVIDPAGEVNLIGAVLTMSNRLIVEGVLNVDFGYVLMTSGNITVTESGTINTTNAGKVDAFGGNIENDGTVNICLTCCVTTKGNWKNTGNVGGSGAATTTSGNMSNTGHWSTAITWCSAGFDSGMPSPENCSDATSTCSAVALPVEFSAFNVELLSDSRVLITWETVSEKNSDYFVVLKSLDGSNWEEIEVVSAAGNSTSLNSYSALDFNTDFNIAYYRLLQVDIDGTTSYSDVKAIAGNKMTEVNIYPNPVRIAEENTFAITNVEDVLVSISDLYGKVVYSTQSMSKTLVISLHDIQSGVYIVNMLTGEGELSSKQLVVMD